VLLGLGKEIVIPEFLRAVQIVLPSCNNSFSGVNEQIIPTYHILDFEVSDFDEPTIIANYMTPERRSCFVEWFRERPVLTED